MKLNILGHEVEVVYPTEPDEELMGLFCPERNVIEIHTQNPNLALSTLMHEILECINYFLELGLKHHQITSLETSIHQVLIANPELNSYNDPRLKEDRHALQARTVWKSGRETDRV